MENSIIAPTRPRNLLQNETLADIVSSLRWLLGLYGQKPMDFDLLGHNDGIRSDSTMNSISVMAWLLGPEDGAYRSSNAHGAETEIARRSWL